MADAHATEEGEAPPPKRSRLRSLGWLLLGTVSGGLGFAAPYLLPRGWQPGAQAATPAEEQAVPLKGAQEHPGFIPFGEVVVNLDEGRLNRYLRVNLTLQVDEAQRLSVTERLESRRSVLKNWLLSYLSDKDMEDIRGAAGQNRLRREIQNHFNSVLFPEGYDRIHEVLFEEFNIQ